MDKLVSGDSVSKPLKGQTPQKPTHVEKPKEHPAQAAQNSSDMVAQNRRRIVHRYIKMFYMNWP